MGLFLQSIKANPEKIYVVEEGPFPEKAPCAFFSHGFIPAERNFDVGRPLNWLQRNGGICWKGKSNNLSFGWIIKPLNPCIFNLRRGWTLSRWDGHSSSLFKTTYLPGPCNLNPEALSCHLVSDRSTPVSKTVLSPTQVRVGQQQAQQHPDPGSGPHSHLIIPDSARLHALQWAHSSPFSCRPGIKWVSCANIKSPSYANTYGGHHRARTQGSFSNPAVYTCETQHQPLVGLLRPLSVPGRSWSHIDLDFVTGILKGIHHYCTCVRPLFKGCPLSGFIQTPHHTWDYNLPVSRILDTWQSCWFFFSDGVPQLSFWGKNHFLSIHFMEPGSGFIFVWQSWFS